MEWPLTMTSCAAFEACFLAGSEANLRAQRRSCRLTVCVCVSVCVSVSLKGSQLAACDMSVAACDMSEW